jgi:hypothetical protein
MEVRGNRSRSLIKYKLMSKREVYGGYQEKYLTGRDIKQLFANSYECFGKHHQQVSSHRMNFEKYYKKIQDNVVYRVFVNDLFCGIFDNDTDDKLYFFGYTNEKPKWAKD